MPSNHSVPRPQPIPPPPPQPAGAAPPAPPSLPPGAAGERRFLDELARWGPQALAAEAPPLRACQRYCRRLARRHYENFTVASWLLPRRLRQHFYNVYAYCRWADDLADELFSFRQSLALLDWWEQQLRECYAGRTRHPVFRALAETIRRFQIPIDPFLDLLVAFRQDQRQRRYETFAEVLQYCRYSANPVGRLVLYLAECHTPDRAYLADSICTGLQLANFCQDVARDWQRGRVYLPQADCRRFGYEEAMFACGEFNEAFRKLMVVSVDRAEGFLRQGLPLIGRVPWELRLDVALFIHGGLAILAAIRAQNYDVWARRPTVSRVAKVKLLARCWWQVRFGNLGKAGR